MRGTTRLLLLCVLSTTGCWTDECGIDCNQDGDPDCVAGNLHPTGPPFRIAAATLDPAVPRAPAP